MVLMMKVSGLIALAGPVSLRLKDGGANSQITEMVSSNN